MSELDWQILFTQHENWLRTVILARVREPSAVDEVLQEVALAAVRQHAPLLDSRKAAPWLYRLAVRQALLYRRRTGRRRKLTARYAERFSPTEHDARLVDPLEWLLSDERRALVRQAVLELPQRDAEILLLKYIQNWSYAQMAERLGLSQSAVEARLHRARARLRHALIAMQASEVP